MNIFMFESFVLLIALTSRTIFAQLQVSQLIRRQYHDGALYEDYATDSASLRYSITNGKGWENLKELAESNYLIGKAMFCSIGPGTWLLYPDNNFGITSKHTLKMLYGEMCVPLDDVNSLQPLGATESQTTHVTAALTFSEKYFASAAHKVKNGSEPPAAIKSVIFLGESNWTINGGEGKKICVSNIGLDGDACFIEDVEGAFSSTAVSIQPGCTEDEEMEEYGLQSCYSPGYREIIYETDFNMENMQKICSGGSDSTDDSKDKFYNVMKVWEYRTLGTEIFKNDGIMTQLTEAKLDLIHAMLDIVDNTCTNLQQEYIAILSEIFRSFHLKNGKVWESDPQNGTEYQRLVEVWNEVSAFFKNCYDLAQNPRLIFNKDCNDPSSARSDRLEILEEYLYAENYDFVIEQFYMIFTYVSTYCYNQIGTEDNTWLELPLILKEDFLYPLRKQWKDPGKWMNYYPLMFNGFDMDAERKTLMNCLESIMLLTPFYDPLARPPEFSRIPGNSTKAEIIGKPGGDKPKQKDARRKRQQQLDDSDESIETNKLGDGNPPKGLTPKASVTPTPPPKNHETIDQKKKITSTTTATTTTTQSTTVSTTTTSTTSSTNAPPVVTTKTDTPEPEGTETQRPSTKKRGKKKKGKRGRKTKRNKKHSKLLRKNKAETD